MQMLLDRCRQRESMGKVGGLLLESGLIKISRLKPAPGWQTQVLSILCCLSLCCSAVLLLAVLHTTLLFFCWNLGIALKCRSGLLSPHQQFVVALCSYAWS